MNTTPVRPLVLCFGGHDPSGGAGIQADIESLAASGCHALPIVTALTEQDTRQVYHFEPVAPSLVQAQVSRVITDMVPDAIKVGMVANQQNLAPILEVVRRYPLVPLVVDPVLAAGFGGSLSSASLAGQLMTQLIPLATVVTPNSEELTRLAAIPDSQPAVKKLLATGCKSLLVTGTHAETEEVINTLYRSGQPPLARHWPRLPHSYHGSGCTLASAIAGRLARGSALEEAVLDAQAYTWESLNLAINPGKGQRLPTRVRPE